MAALGNIGQTMLQGRRPFVFGGSAWTTSNHASSLATITAGAPSTPVVLLFKGSYILTTPTDSSGNASFYNLNDGVYYAYQHGTGNAWSISIASSVATVLKISSSGTPGFGHFG